MIGAEVLALAVFEFHFHHLAGFQPAEAQYGFDLIFLEQELDALAHAGGHLAAALHHSGKVHLSLSDRDAVILGMAYVFKHLGALEQGLCRDAAPVEAYPAEFGFFHHSHFHAKLGGADGRYIAAWTTADHDQVVF